MFSTIKSWLIAGGALLVSIVYALFQRERAKNAEFERDIEKANNDLLQKQNAVEREIDAESAKKIEDINKARAKKIQEAKKIKSIADVNKILGKKK